MVTLGEPEPEGEPGEVELEEVAFWRGNKGLARASGRRARRGSIIVMMRRWWWWGGEE
jgi:hypothetical protein